MTDTTHPTVATVVEYAATLRARAQRTTAPDSPDHNPYHDPYAPTEAAARKLCQRKTRELLAALRHDAPPDEKALVEAAGPGEALREMKWRSARTDTRFREDLERERQARQRLARNQQRAARDRDAGRAGRTPGQRIDHALAQLSVIAAGPGTHFEPKVSGGSGPGAPTFPGDPVARASALVRDAVRAVEDEVETARRRRVENERAA